MEQPRIDRLLSRHPYLQDHFDIFRKFTTDNFLPVFSDYLELQIQKNSKKKTKKYTSDANYEMLSKISIKLLRCNTVHGPANLVVTSDQAYGIIQENSLFTFHFTNPGSLKLSVVDETKSQNHHSVHFGLFDLLKELNETLTNLNYILFRYLRQTNEEDVLIEITLHLDEKLISLISYQSIPAMKLSDSQVADITTMIKIARDEPIDLDASQSGDAASISTDQLNHPHLHRRNKSRLQESFYSGVSCDSPNN